MAESKTTELHSVPILSDDDEFIVVDKSITSAEDADVTGKTSKISMQSFVTECFQWSSGRRKRTQGQKGQKDRLEQTERKVTKHHKETPVTAPSTTRKLCSCTKRR